RSRSQGELRKSVQIQTQPPQPLPGGIILPPVEIPGLMNKRRRRKRRDKCRAAEPVLPDGSSNRIELED
ncbi:hypothetical protein RvY_19501, partial [Ramazzottius varieornatus]